MREHVLELTRAQLPATDEVARRIGHNVQAGRWVEVMRDRVLMVRALDGADTWAVDVLVDRAAELGGLGLAVIPGHAEVGIGARVRPEHAH